MVPCTSCCFPNSAQARLCGHCGIYLKPIGDYVLTERIGTGGFADVYRATNLYTGHPAAIKLLHRKLIHDKEIEQRFLREVEILQDLRSPNVVQIFDYGVIEELGLYLIMEWLDGETLDVYVREKPDNRLSFEETVPLFTQLLYGLSRIHEKGVVHRDLKPKNFMVVMEKGKPMLKILDFGIAWVSGGQDLTERGMFVGSTYFMAPEQFKAQKGLFGPQTDLYVAGQLLFWMLTGKHVFTANTLQVLAVRHCVEQPPTMGATCPELSFSEELEAIVAKAFQKKPPGRYQTALEFLQAFRRAMPSQREVAKTESLPRHSPVAKPPQTGFTLGTPPVQVGAGGGLPGLTGGASQMAAPMAQAGGGAAPRLGAPAGVMLKERIQPAPPLKAPPIAPLQAPDLQALRFPSQAPVNHTPMSPLKALDQAPVREGATIDSVPAEPEPIPTFRRKTTSMQSIPSQKHPNTRKIAMWALACIGAGLLAAGIFLFFFPHPPSSLPKTPAPILQPMKFHAPAARPSPRPQSPSQKP